MPQPFRSLSYILITGWTVATISGLKIKSSNIHAPQVSQEDANILDHSVCNLDPDYLAAFGHKFLKQLNRCESFTPDQVKVIQDVLRRGNNPFGPPSDWSSSTLDQLNGLFRIFDQDILRDIPKAALIPWLKHVFHMSHLPREQVLPLIKSLQPSRSKRDAGCAPDKVITEKMLDDPLLSLSYTSEELDACLVDEFLIKNLAAITIHPFTDEQLKVIKSHLDKIYPDGYTDEVLGNLGGLCEIMTEKDIKSSKITSSRTLESLLKCLPMEPMASLIIQRYTDNVNQLDADALNVIGPKYICHLNKDQLEMISEEAIKMAKPLEVSNCSQDTVTILYQKAKRAFSDRHNQFPDYYNGIKPYIRGAPADDLKALSKNPINMDIETFMTMSKETLMKLTPSDVKGLLGTNIGELKNYHDVPPLSEWIPIQKQSELNGLRLTGGAPEGYINLTRVKNRKK